MESVSLRLYSDAYRATIFLEKKFKMSQSGTGKHPNINVETQIPLEQNNHVHIQKGVHSQHLKHFKHMEHF